MPTEMGGDRTYRVAGCLPSGCTGLGCAGCRLIRPVRLRDYRWAFPALSFRLFPEAHPMEPMATRSAVSRIVT
jgi:hypothetical protein